MPSTAEMLVQSPMEILRNVRHVMHTQFPGLDVKWLYEYVDAGAEGVLTDYLPPACTRTDGGATQCTYGADGDVSDIRDADKSRADNAAKRQYERLVAPKMTEFAGLLETVAPMLVRYSNMASAIRGYKRKELAQLRTMKGLAIVLMIALACLGIWYMYRILQSTLETWRWITVVCFALLALLVFHLAMWVWIRMLDIRIRDILAVDMSFIDKYDHNLAKNVFVRYAEAYSRGQAKTFASEYTVQQIQELEDTPEEVEAACAANQDDGEDGGGGGGGGTDVCTLNCGEQLPSLADEMAKRVKTAWETKNNLRACGKATLVMLQYLASIHDGTVFDLRDRNGMRLNIRNGVDEIRRFIYRRSDVNAYAEVDAEGERRRVTPLQIVKDEILPLLRIRALETADLVPRPSAVQKMDASVTERSECWRMCTEDPNCAWAFFDPQRGCLRASRCDSITHGCVEADKPDGRRLTFVAADDDRSAAYNGHSKSTALIKAAEQPVLYVCHGGLNAAMSDVAAPVGARDGQGSSMDECADAEACHLLQDGSRKLGLPDQKPHGMTEMQRVFGAPRTLEESDFCLKTSGARLFDGMLREGRAAYASLLNATPNIVAAILEVLKRRRDIRFDLLSYAPYIHGELEGYYGGQGSYTRLRPLVDDALREAVAQMKEVRTADAVQGRAGLYISLPRFEEKMRALNIQETEQLMRTVGKLSLNMRRYETMFTEGADATSIGRSLDSQILRSFITDVIMGLVLVVVIVVANRIHAFLVRDINAQSLTRTAILSVTAFVFGVILMVTALKRSDTMGRYNRTISTANGKRLVQAGLKATYLVGSQYESRLRQRQTAADTSIDARASALELYREVGHDQRVTELTEGGATIGADDSSGKDSDMRQLFAQLRGLVETHERCNTMRTTGRDAGFPYYEVVIYALSSLAVILIVAYALWHFSPLEKMRNISMLNGIRDEMRRGIPPPSDVERIITCSKTPEETMQLVATLSVIALSVLSIFVIMFMTSSTDVYERGLYASSMYSDGRCAG